MAKAKHSKNKRENTFKVTAPPNCQLVGKYTLGAGCTSRCDVAESSLLQ